MSVVRDRTASVFTVQAPDGIRSVTLTGDTAYCTCGQRCCGHVDMARQELRRECEAWQPPGNVRVLPASSDEFVRSCWKPQAA